MILIPAKKLKEWEAAFDAVSAQTGCDTDKVCYVAHCAAQWAYMKGMSDMQYLVEDDYH